MYTRTEELAAIEKFEPAKLTKQYLKSHALKEACIRHRIEKVARMVTLIRAEGWGYKKHRSSFDQKPELPSDACLIKYELTNWNSELRETRKEGPPHMAAEFMWSRGDWTEHLTVDLPPEYLSLSDYCIQLKEQAKVDALKEVYDQKARAAAQTAALVKADKEAAEREATIEKCKATLPGFDDLDPDVQEKMIAMVMGK